MAATAVETAATAANAATAVETAATAANGAAAVETATTAANCAAVEAATASRVAAEAGTAVITAANLTMSYIAVARVAASIAVAAPTRASPVARASIIAATEPRASTDENAAGEPARAVVAVGSACVRVIRIVTVGADGSRTNVSGADPDAHGNSLRMGVWSYRQAKSEQSEDHKILGISHIWAPSEPVKPCCNLLNSDGLLLATASVST